MKKGLFLVAAALVALASCTEKEVTVEPQEIGFRAYTAKVTKAPIEGSDYLSTAPNFRVFATLQESGTYPTDKASAKKYFESEVRFDNSDGYKIWRTFSESANDFVKYYYPMSGSLTFVAVSPYDVESAFSPTTATLSITDYEPASTIVDQADVMYSKIAASSNKSANDTGYTGSSKQGAPIVFNHALSQIIFKAQTTANYTADNMKFTIDHLKVVDIPTKGNLSVVNDVLTGDVDGWTLVGTTKATFEPYTDAATAIPYATALDINKHLLMIPQTLTDNVKVEVTYSMHSTATPAAFPSTTKVVTKTLSAVLAQSTLNANKKYIITLKLGADEILFSPSITDWDTPVEKEAVIN